MSTTAFIDSDAFPWAYSYYGMIPWQVVAANQDIPISVRVRIPRMSLLHLLQHMASRLRRNGSAIIVAHGTALGLTMPLVPQSRMTSDIRVIDLLNGFRPDDEISPMLRIRTNQVQELRQLAGRVRSLGLRRVELRACNMGQNTTSLLSLKRFFGVDILGAPNVLNSYGELTVGTPSQNVRYWSRWQQQYPDARIYTLDHDEKVGLAPERHVTNRGRVHTLVTSHSAMRDWVREYLARERRPIFGNMRQEIPYHALFLWNEPFPMLWPADTGYTAHIVHV